MRRAAILLVVLTGCLPEWHSAVGYACDGAHPCPDGLFCVASVCQATPSADGGGGDGGEPRDGGVDAGELDDAGTRWLWEQTVDGFDGQRVLSCPGCTLNKGANNDVSASVDVSGGRDVYTVTDPRHFSVTRSGTLKGQLFIPDAFPDNTSGVVTGVNANAAFVVNVVLNSNHLGLYTLGGLVADQGDFQSNTNIGLDAGVWHDVELRWNQGKFRELYLNGQRIVATYVNYSPGPLANDSVITELRLGINNYNGDAGSPWAVQLRNWAYSDDPDAGRM